MRPFLRYVALYAAIELTAAALLIWALGLGWTMLLLAVTFMAGMVLAASQLKGQLATARRARRDPHGAVADGALVGLGSFLVFLPGVVSTAAGALMLAPPTRSAMRPLATSLVSRGIMRQVRAVDLDQFVNRSTARTPFRGDYIDGEVLGEVIPRLPARR